MTRPEDALAAARLGADAIGMVFYPPSPRAITLDRARAIAAALPPFVTLVALFVDPEPRLVEDVIHALPVGLLQFHGDETPADCERYGRPYIKAVRMREDVVLSHWMERFSSAAGLLPDTYRKDVPGGTGQTFDWSRIPLERAMPLVLAGGLNPDNVREAVRIARPFAVDVSGGVESAKGIKDADRMARFMDAVSR